MRLIFGGGSDAAKEQLLALIKEDVANKQSIILLVPEQETVITERRMLSCLPPTAQLHFEVLNFTRLANRIFREVGGLSYRNATPGVRALIMWNTLKKLSPSLQHYSTAASDGKLCEKMLSAVAQFKAYCVLPEQLASAADALSESDPLQTKLGDLARVFSAYTGELGERFDDVADELTRAEQRLREHPSLLANTHVYVDSFTDFTGQELRLLALLMQRADTLTVTTPLAAYGDKGIHLHSAAHTLQLLISMAKKADLTVNTISFGKQRPTSGIAYLCENLFEMDAEKAPLQFCEKGDVSLIACDSPYDEAEYAATKIAELVRNGASYRDISVVVRDVTAYEGILDAALEKEAIPYYISERTDVTVRPLIKLILFALRIKQHDFRKEDVVGYLKTGLCGVDADDVNFLEEYAEVWRVNGARAFANPFVMNPDGYCEEISARGKRILEGANRARAKIVPPLLTLFAELDAAENAAAMCRALYEFLCSIGVPEALKARAQERLYANERRDAEELSRLWGVVLDALESMTKAIGDERLDTAEFTEALLLLFSATDMGAIPTSADEVMIGSAATLRAEPTRFVILLGLNEGSFPQAVKESGLLSDAEKARLSSEFDIKLSGNSDAAASDELFYLYRACALPRERLFLSYAQTATDGRAAAPSLAVTRYCTLFDVEKPPKFTDLPTVDKIFSPEVGREKLRALSPVEQQALRELLEESGEAGEDLQCLLTPVADTEASVPPSLAGKLFHAGSFNPTGLEKFASCKFAYYCSKILSLREEPTDALDAAAVGIFIHYVLENTFIKVKNEKKAFDAYTDDEIDKIVSESVAEYRDYLIKAGGGLTPRAEALLSRLATLARIVISSLFEEFSDSSFYPAFLELDLAKEGEQASIKMGKTSVPLSGKADRVDCYVDEDGQAYLRVADYKTGRKTFHREDITKGSCLQMPLYLYALCKQKHPYLANKLGLSPDTDFKPAGITYLSTAVGNENVAARVDQAAAVQDAESRLKRSGLLPADGKLQSAISHSKSTSILGAPQTRKARALSDGEFEALFTELSDTVVRISGEMKSGAAHVAPYVEKNSSPCTHCGFAAVCRSAQKK